MRRSHFPRWGCAFCTDTHGTKESHSQHLDDFIPEVSAFKMTRLKTGGSHFVNLIRAIRRRARRQGENKKIVLKESVFDSCHRWKLYIRIVSCCYPRWTLLIWMQDNTEQLVAFQRRRLRSRREWRDLAQAYVDAQAIKKQIRGEDDDDDDTASESGDDTYDPVWPAIEAVVPQPAVIPQPPVIPQPAPPSSSPAIPRTFLQLSMNQAVSGSGRDGIISQHGLGSPVRSTIRGINGDGNSIQTACKTIRKKVFTRQPLFTHEIYQGDMVSTPQICSCGSLFNAHSKSFEAGPSNTVARNLVDLTGNPVSPPRSPARTAALY